jgi:hypothetical protein
VRVSGKLNPQNVSILIHGLRLMGVTVSELTDETWSCLLASLKRTVSSMNEQHIAECIQRCVICGFVSLFLFICWFLLDWLSLDLRWISYRL